MLETLKEFERWFQSLSPKGRIQFIALYALMSAIAGVIGRVFTYLIGMGV